MNKKVDDNLFFITDRQRWKIGKYDSYSIVNILYTEYYKCRPRSSNLYHGQSNF